MNTLFLTAIADRLPTASCSFSVSIDAGAFFAATPTGVGTFQVTIPDGNHRVVVDVAPASAEFWPFAAEFDFDPTGMLNPISPTVDFAPATFFATPFGSTTTLIAHLCRVRDATQKALQTISNVPANRTQMVPAGWPPATWDTDFMADLNFVNEPPVDSGDISFFADSIDPDAEQVVLEVANVAAPKALAVSWPQGILRSDFEPPTPFLIYIHPMVGQNAPDFYTGFPYPFGFDYMYFVLWRYINYTADPLTSDPFAKGLAYQMAESGRNAVIVVPCNGLGPEIGVFMNAGQVQLILQDVQAYMFRRAGAFLPPFLGRTALAGFSAGNLLVTQFLNDPSNRSHSFYLDTLQELYMFEAPNAVDWVNAAVAWQSAGNAGGKVIRGYQQGSIQALAQLVGGALPASPFVVDSANGTRTGAALPPSAWNRAATSAGNPAMAASATAFQDSHQLISAMMLTDALRRSSF